MQQKGREEICSCAHSNSEMNDSLEIILNKAEVGWADSWSLLAPVSFCLGALKEAKHIIFIFI